MITNPIHLIDQIEEYYRNPTNQPLAKYPGVTRVLGGTGDKSGLDAWRARVGEEEADRIVNESRAIGDSLDRLFNNSLIDKAGFSIEDHKGELGYDLWKQLAPTIKKIEPIKVQMKVWSDHLKVMGYTDCFGILNGQITVIDCKNSKKEKREEYLQDYYLQCTMYGMMIYDMFGIKPTQIAVLVARRDSVWPQIEVRPMKGYISTALRRIDEYYKSI